MVPFGVTLWRFERAAEALWLAAERRSVGRLNVKFALVAALAVSQLTACVSNDASGVYLHVFDCYTPVPPGYAIHTDNGDSVYLYRRGPVNDPSGGMLVSRYEGIPSERWQLLSRSSQGGLIIEQLRPLSARPDTTPLVRIHNEHQSLSLVGDATRYADSMIASCLADKR